METLRIRVALPDDAALLADMGARTFLAAFGDDPRNRPEDVAAYAAEAYNESTQAAELADPGSTYLIAEVAGAAAGFAMVDESAAPEVVAGDRPLQITRVYVDGAFQGDGVGSALIRRCIDDARRSGNDVVWLGVWEHNPRAIALYRRLGFTEVGDMPFTLGTDPQRDIVMVLPI